MSTVRIILKFPPNAQEELDWCIHYPQLIQALKVTSQYAITHAATSRPQDAPCPIYHLQEAKSTVSSLEDRVHALEKEMWEERKFKRE